MSLLVSLVFSITSHGQSLDEVIKVGNQSFMTKDYYNAFRCYGTVLDYLKRDKYKGDWDTLYIKYRYAEAAQRFNYFEGADSVYSILREESKGKNMDVYARSTFNLARVKQSLAEEAFAPDMARLNPATLEDARTLYQEFLNDKLSQNLKLFPGSGKETPEALTEVGRGQFDHEARKGISDCERSIQFAREHPEGIKRDPISRLPDIVNSEYSDLAPMLRGNELFFSSIKFPSKPDRLKRQSRIYSQVLKAAYSGNAPESRDSIVMVDTLAKVSFFNDDDDFSHTIHNAITQDGQWMYFSHCPQGKGEEPDCHLYRRRMTASNSEEEPEYLSINVDNAIATQPSISYDPWTGKQWLYYATNRGTKGDLDIWRCQILNGGDSLGVAEAVPGVNTEWNEATPFMHFLSGQLFFSSDRESSFGLYDNFVRKSCGSEMVIENLGLKLNSGYNDQYYFLSPDGDRAYFSSDRPESTRFIDSLNACCQDIFTYPIDVDTELEVLVKGCEGLNLTAQADIKIYDVTYCDCRKGENLVPYTLQAQAGDTIAVATLKKYHSYKVFASFEGYNPDSTAIALPLSCDGEEAEMVKASMSLAPTFVDITFTVVDSLTREPLEPGEYTLDVSSIGGAPETIQRQPYRLRTFSDYTLSAVAKDPIYIPKTMELNNVQPTPTCKETIPVELAPCFPDSLKGIIFYFDNDKPSRIVRSVWTTTNERFNQALVNPYLDQKKTYRDFNLKPIPVQWDLIKDSIRFESRAGFGEGVDTLLSLSNPASESNSEEIPLRFFVRKSKKGVLQVVPDEVTVGGRIDRFFERDLEGNLNKFNNLIQYVKGYLETGNDLDITMRAYCSIRVSDIRSTYNDSLAVRRIRCIESTIREALDRAWKAENVDDRRKQEFGKLTIIREALSDSKAAKNFPDPNLDPSADDGGKYFLSAALDRRVEITSISIKSCKDNDNLSSQVTIKNP